MYQGVKKTEVSALVSQCASAIQILDSTYLLCLASKFSPVTGRGKKKKSVCFFIRVPHGFHFHQNTAKVSQGNHSLGCLSTSDL